MRRYMAYIDEIKFSIGLDGNELCSFITHFGNFGDIEIYDQKQKEVLLNTKGIFIDSFYPDEYNRETAQHRARHLSYLFDNYRYHKKLKYPKGRLRSVYKELDKYLTDKGYFSRKSIEIEKFYDGYSRVKY